MQRPSSCINCSIGVTLTVSGVSLCGRIWMHSFAFVCVLTRSIFSCLCVYWFTIVHFVLHLNVYLHAYILYTFKAICMCVSLLACVCLEHGL